MRSWLTIVEQVWEKSLRFHIKKCSYQKNMHYNNIQLTGMSLSVSGLVIGICYDSIFGVFCSSEFQNRIVEKSFDCN